MIHKVEFPYETYELETEKASNSYLMSMFAMLFGLPLPIMNLLATFGFYLGNRNATYFVRWHCTQALLSQASLFIVNSIGFWWFISILLGRTELSSAFFAYLFTIILFNLTEFIFTIYSAIHTRKGTHIEWWFYGPLTNLICKPDKK